MLKSVKKIQLNKFHKIPNHSNLIIYCRHIRRRKYKVANESQIAIKVFFSRIARLNTGTGLIIVI